MRLSRYRHFLRLRVKDDELTIYPIAIGPPKRSGWQWNPTGRRGDQTEPEVIPKTPLKPHLIEGPIVIRAPKPRKPQAPAIRTSGAIER